MEQATGRLISVIDDDRATRLAVKGLLRSAGLAAEVYASAEEFLNSGRVSATACLVLDVRLPNMSGLELQRRLAAAGISVPVIFITSHDDEQARGVALEAGAVAFLSKPARGRVLLERVRSVVNR